jgi:hypothetical protein
MRPPYVARAELYRSAGAGFDEVVGLKLEPILSEYVIPFSHMADARSEADAAIELARQMVRQTRGLITQAICGSVFKGKIPDDFDWERLEQTELEEITAIHEQDAKRIEHLEAIRLRYRGFMEAHGWNPDAIERMR